MIIATKEGTLIRVNMEGLLTERKAELLAHTIGQIFPKFLRGRDEDWMALMVALEMEDSRATGGAVVEAARMILSDRTGIAKLAPSFQHGNQIGFTYETISVTISENTFTADLGPHLQSPYPPERYRATLHAYLLLVLLASVMPVVASGDPATSRVSVIGVQPSPLWTVIQAPQ